MQLFSRTTAIFVFLLICVVASYAALAMDPAPGF